jgi:hypothetical protein
MPNHTWLVAKVVVEESMTSSDTPRLLSPFSPVSEPPERRFAERLASTSRPKLAEKKIKKILATVHPSEVLPSLVERTMDEFGLGNAEAVGLKTTMWDQALEAFLKVVSWQRPRWRTYVLCGSCSGLKEEVERLFTGGQTRELDPNQLSLYRRWNSNPRPRAEESRPNPLLGAGSLDVTRCLLAQQRHGGLDVRRREIAGVVLPGDEGAGFGAAQQNRAEVLKLS